MNEMKVALFVLLLSSIANTSIPPKISSDENIQTNHEFGDFIEISEGQDLTLVCAGRHDDLNFKLPNLTEHLGFEDKEYSSRAVITLSDNSEVLLSITNMKQSDTGMYTCYSEYHQSLNHSVYVFVRGDSVFVPLKADGFVFQYGEVVIPCKSTIFLSKSDVELHENGNILKTANKEFDPRYGFQLSRKTLDSKTVQNVPFLCKYKSDSKMDVSYYITELEKYTAKRKDFEFYFEESLEYPYVGINYTLTCHAKYIGSGEYAPYLHTLDVSCENCEDKTVVHAIKGRDSKSQNAPYSISSLKPENAGKYVCTWKYENHWEETIEKILTIAPKRGQIRVVEYSPNPSIKRVREGEKVEISAKLKVYPPEKERYRSKWIRKYTTPLKKGNQTIEISTDDHYKMTSDYDQSDVVEKLEIDNIETKMSGTYILQVEHDGTVSITEWQIAVENDAAIPVITVREPSMTIYDQPFYKPGSSLHIDCLTSSLPPAKVHFKKRYLADPYSEFNEIDPSEITAVSGTYETGYVWNKNVDEDVEVECTSIFNNKRETRTKKILVAKDKPNLRRQIFKSDKGKELETETDGIPEIYEGDSVELICTVPKGVDWNVTWVFHDQVQMETETRTDHYDKLVVLRIDDLKTEKSGKYKCVVGTQDGTASYELISPLNVIQVTKPAYSESDSDEPVYLNYNDKGELDCKMYGKPEPQYQWYKDDKIYENQAEKVGGVLRIVRVIGEDDGVFTCRATNRAGSADRKIRVVVNGAESTKKSSGVLYWLLGIVIVIAVTSTSLSFLAYWRQKKRNEPFLHLGEQFKEPVAGTTSPNPKVPIDQRVDQLGYCVAKSEIKFENIEFGNEIGSGQFGKVFAAYLRKPLVQNEASLHQRLQIAVKTVKSVYNLEQGSMLTEEIKIMGAIGKHPNVLAFVGAVTEKIRSGKIFLATEFCSLGNLKNYLLTNREFFVNELVVDNEPDEESSSYETPKSAMRTKYASQTNPQWEQEKLLNQNSQSITTLDLISFSLQIANGMKYLADVPCVHRDLAARNVLLTSNKIVRVADFGMSKHCNDKSYYRESLKSKAVVRPVRWMALEAITQNKYTQESDVWSFAITLYEIFSLGGVPYKGLANENVTEGINNGQRCEKPEFCHEEIYGLMKECWDKDPTNRPSFEYCVGFLEQHLKKASPKLVTTLAENLEQEARKQHDLDSWLIDEEDPRILARVGTNIPDETERYLMEDR